MGKIGHEHAKQSKRHTNSRRHRRTLQKISAKDLAVADTLTREERSERMSRVRSRGNRATELRLVALMRLNRVKGWRRGAPLPGRPDFIFPAAKVAVFVDGCFWHRCPRHTRTPKTHVAFWKSKLARNAQRDREVGRALRAAGWKVLRIWECALAPSRVKHTLGRITRALAG